MRQAQRPPLVRTVQGPSRVMSQRPRRQDSGTQSRGNFHVKATEGQTSGKRSDGLLEAPFVSEV